MAEEKKTRKVTQTEVDVFLSRWQIQKLGGSCTTPSDFLSHADMSGLDLHGRDFSSLTIRHSKFDGADLSECAFRNTDLSGSSFDGTRLSGCFFQGANLSNTSFVKCDAGEAFFVRCNMFQSNFCGAYLVRSYMCECPMRDSRFQNADFFEATISTHFILDSDFSSADFRCVGAVNIGDPFLAKMSSFQNIRSNNGLFAQHCPEEGSFIGFKKCFLEDRDQDQDQDQSQNNHYINIRRVFPCIVKLLIPEDARRSSGVSNKCRCSKAKVLAIENMDGSPSKVNVAFSREYEDFIYTIGETVYPTEPFCEDRWDECASGIHFFLTREEAREYV